MGWFLWFVWFVWFVWSIWFGRDQPDKPNKPDERSSSARYHRPDFNLIAVVEHLVFCDKIITFDHQVCLDREIQLAQEFLDLLGAFDFDGSSWMAQLDLHGRMIRPALAGLQQSIQLQQSARPLNHFGAES
jgi:hypothetical protein